MRELEALADARTREWRPPFPVDVNARSVISGLADGT